MHAQRQNVLELRPWFAHGEHSALAVAIAEARHSLDAQRPISSASTAASSSAAAIATSASAAAHREKRHFVFDLILKNLQKKKKELSHLVNGFFLIKKIGTS
jgi:hypothetical protein